MEGRFIVILLTSEGAAAQRWAIPRWVVRSLPLLFLGLPFGLGLSLSLALPRAVLQDLTEIAAGEPGPSAEPAEWVEPGEVQATNWRAVSFALMAEAAPGQAQAGDYADLIPYEVWGPARCSGIQVPDNRGGFGRHVALTFDDGPDPLTTPTLLRVLREHRAPATFFINGARVDSPESAELLREIQRDRLFTLGNHGFTHDDLSKLDGELVAKEVDDTKTLLDAVGASPTWFRFPFGHANCNAAAIVRRRGYHVAGWHVNSADWCFAEMNGFCSAERHRWVPNPLRRDMVGYVLQQLEKWEGGIVLFHDRLPYTAERLDAILTRLENESFVFTTLDDVRVFPKLNGYRRRWRRSSR